MYEKFLSKHVQTIKPSGIRKYFDLASEMEGVISLGVGEPDFDTPLHWVVALSFSDELVKAMVTLWRFRSKKWIHVLVRREQECEISGA